MKQYIPTIMIFTLLQIGGCQKYQEDLYVAPAIAEMTTAAEADQPFHIENFEIKLPLDRRSMRYRAQTLELLSEPVTLKTENLRLKALIDFVRTETGTNITVNWNALELVGIDHDSLLSVDTKQTPAWKVLELALDEVSADCFDDDKAGFRSAEGVIRVSTLRDLKRQTETRAYDVSWYVRNDLSIMYQLYDKPPAKNKPTQEGADQNKPPTERGLPEARGLEWQHQPERGAEYTSSEEFESRYDKHGNYVHSRQELVDQVVELITVTVGDQDEWLDEESTITELSNVLIVKTSPKNHEDIVALLDALFRARVAHFERRARFREAVKLLGDAESLRMEQEYRQALKLIDQALKVAPRLAEAHVLRKIVVGAIRD